MSTRHFSNWMSQESMLICGPLRSTQGVVIECLRSATDLTESPDLVVQHRNPVASLIGRPTCRCQQVGWS